MDLKLVKEFIELAKKSGVAELEYEHSDVKLCVKLMPSGVTYQAQPMQVASTVSHANSASVEKSASSSKGLIEITSPFVGTFYRSASPTSEAYAKVGDRISSGKVLCIVEAMKIMNEIESEVSGEIVEICVENETYVEFGQVLFKVKP